MSQDSSSGWAPRDGDAEPTVVLGEPDAPPESERTIAFETPDSTGWAERTLEFPPVEVPQAVPVAPPPRVAPVRVPEPAAPMAEEAPFDPRATVEWQYEKARTSNRPSTDIGLLLLRLCALPLLLHGFGHVLDFFPLLDTLNTHPVAQRAPEVAAGLIVAGQLGLPLLLAAGFGTRFAGAAQALLMAGIYVLFILPDQPLLDPSTRTLANEGILAYAAVGVVLLFTGPGRISLDHAITASSRDRRIEKRVTKRLTR